MIYDDSNYQQLIRPAQTTDGTPQWYPRHSRYGTVEASSMGLVPLTDYPDLLPDPADFKAIIQHCHDEKIFPVYWMDNSGVFNDGWYQKSYGFCWAYGLTASAMGKEAVEGKPPKRLSPFSLGWLVNWQNSGFFCDRALAGANAQGIAEATFVPEYNLRPSTFKAGWQENALLHRPLEWWDTQKTSDIQMLRQLLAILRTGTPLFEGFDWWRHALVCVSMEWDESQPNNIVTKHWNSHNDGVIAIAGSRGVPDEGYGIRAMLDTD